LVQHFPKSGGIEQSYFYGVFGKRRDAFCPAGWDQGAYLFPLFVRKRNGDLSGRHAKYHTES